MPPSAKAQDGTRVIGAIRNTPAHAIQSRLKRFSAGSFRVAEPPPIFRAFGTKKNGMAKKASRKRVRGGLRPELVLFGEIVFGTKLRRDPDNEGQAVGVGLFVDGPRKCVPAFINPDYLDPEIVWACRTGARPRDDHLLKLISCSALPGHVWGRTPRSDLCSPRCR
jgi:hypothetical protein